MAQSENVQQSSLERQLAAAAVAVAAAAAVAAVAVGFEQSLVSVHHKQFGWASTLVLLEAVSLLPASGPAPAVAPAAAQAHAAVGCHWYLRPQL